MDNLSSGNSRFRDVAERMIHGLFHNGGISALNWIADRFSIKHSNDRFVLRRKNEPVFQVLTFHRVGSDADGVFDPVPCRVFENYIRHIRRHYRVFTAGDAWARLLRGSLPHASAVVTFDDGYRDNYQYAFEILKKYDVPATLFLATAPVDNMGPLWHDRMFASFACTEVRRWEFQNQVYQLDDQRSKVTAVEKFAEHARSLSEEDRETAIAQLGLELNVKPEEAENRSPMLTWNQVREMAEWGIEIGAHTVTHPILSRLPLERQREEIVHSMKRIEEMVGISPKVFAYPNGKKEDFNAQTVDILIESGIRAAYTTVFGSNSKEVNSYHLYRGAAWAQNLPRFAMQMVWNRFLG